LVGIKACTGRTGDAELLCSDGRHVTAKWTAKDCSNGYGDGVDDKGSRFAYAFGTVDAEALQRLASAATKIVGPPPVSPSVVASVPVQSDPFADALASYERGAYAISAPFFSRLAQIGDANSQSILGEMYMYGRGVPQDYAQSIQWYRRAAAQGNASAQYALGVLYEDGKVIYQDVVKAHMWLNLAAASLTGPAGKQAAEYRDRLVAMMTQEQVVEAQALARQCQRQELSECDELPSSVEKLATLPPPPTPAPSPTQEVIPVEFTNGIFVIPVVMNDVTTLKFVLDGGAADVSIPADVFLTLMRTGTIQTSDFMGERPYEIADGSKAASRTFRIRSLKVGDMVVRDVTGSVSSPGSKLLLGQSFLRRLKSWSMDNLGHALIIE